MVIYILVIFIVFFLVTLSLDRRVKSEIPIVLLLLWGLTIFAASRIDTGNDYDAYLLQFENSKDIFDFEKVQWNFEPGYEYIVSICKTVFDSFHFFLFVFSFMTLCLAFYVFKRDSPYPLLSFLLLFAYVYFIQIMGQMRQPIAILLVYLFLPLTLQSRKKFCLLIPIIGLIAYFFHKSIYLIIPFVLLADRYISPKLAWLCLGGSIFCCFLFVKMDLLIFVPDNFYLKPIIRQYLEINDAPFFTMGMLDKIGTLCLVSMYYYKYAMYENKKIRLYYNMYFYGVCMYFILFRVSLDFAARGTQALSYASFFLLPIIYNEVRQKEEKLLLLSLIYLLSFYVSLGVLSYEVYIPYKSIFFSL